MNKQNPTKYKQDFIKKRNSGDQFKKSKNKQKMVFFFPTKQQ